MKLNKRVIITMEGEMHISKSFKLHYDFIKHILNNKQFLYNSLYYHVVINKMVVHKIELFSG